MLISTMDMKNALFWGGEITGVKALVWIGWQDCTGTSDVPSTPGVAQDQRPNLVLCPDSFEGFDV